VPEPAKREADPQASRPERSPSERAADHAAIDRLSGELLPALIAKLGATGLGELEVREGGWRVRLRRPAEVQGSAPTASPGTRERRPGDRERSARAGAIAASAHAAGSLTPVGPGRDGRDTHGEDGHPVRDGRDRLDGLVRDDGKIAATSPAVGIFHPRPEARAGTRVRAGDRLGSVDMLGVPQEVVAPADGVVGASLIEPGDAVEYGQELILLEFASAGSPEA
jgi:biotin carboxyl carrier protein